MITTARVLDMLQMQEELEVRIGGVNWRDAKHNYALAICQETAELIDWYGWKWWKDIDTTANFPQMQVELIDIWHFFLAWSLMRDEFATPKLMHDLANNIIITVKSISLDEEQLPFLNLAMGLSFSMMSGDGFPMTNFVRMCAFVDMDFDELYILYCSKNVLNTFRQDHGYADGTYDKIWDGREDNDHLYDIVKSMSNAELEGSALRVEMYKALSVKYELVKSLTLH